MQRENADRPLVMILRGPSANADWAADNLAAAGLWTTRGFDLEYLDTVAAADRLLLEMGAASLAKQSGRDPESSDELTPAVFAAPFRDRLAGSGVTFRRDDHGRLAASGPVVALLAQIEAILRVPTR